MRSDGVRGSLTTALRYDPLAIGGDEFARVKLVAMPNDAGRGFEFHSNASSSAVPKEYIPGVEKGLRSAIGPGTIAGDPIFDVCVTLTDGAFHDISSSPLAFEVAARMALNHAMEMGQTKMFEPVMSLQIASSADFSEGIVADLESRGCRIQRRQLEEDMLTINAPGPLTNLLGYDRRLEALSGGSVSAVVQFDHFERLPPDEPDPPFRPAGAIRLLR
jgi:elongation factor G